MKKVLALMLALVLVLSLAACGGNNNKIAGKWVSKAYVQSTLDKVIDQVGTSTLSSILMNIMRDNIKNTYSNLTIDVVFEFDKNNGYKYYFQGVSELESAIKANVEEAAEEFYDKDSLFRTNNLYKNMDRYSATQMIVKTVMDTLDLHNRFDDSLDGEYDIDNEKIYFIQGKTNKDDYLLYQLNDDKLTISDVVSSSSTSVEAIKDLMCGEYTKVKE